MSIEPPFDSFYLTAEQIAAVKANFMDAAATRGEPPEADCPACDGTGMHRGRTCPRCRGTGTEQ